MKWPIPRRFWTRRCRGCADPDPHDSHLTFLGRIALGLPWRVADLEREANK